MNVRMLKKIVKKVKYEEIVKEGITFYEVSLWSREDEEWKNVMSTTRRPKALQRKHNAWLCTIHNIGKTGFLFDRRKKRARQRKARLAKAKVNEKN